jgi:hypothetical protein
MDKNKKGFAAVEYWYNGNEPQTSAIYYGNDAKKFVDEYEKSNTFASLFTGTVDEVRKFVEEFLDK